MTREQYLKMKKEQKALATKIRNEKNEFRNTSREFSTFTKENGSSIDYYKGRINSSKWELARPGYNKLYDKIEGLRSKISDDKSVFRLNHVLYSLARGRTLQQIEPKVREGNELPMDWLKKQLEFYGITEPTVA